MSNISPEDRAKIVAWLTQAEQKGITPAREIYVLNDRCMCPLAAIYTMATGKVPSHWDADLDMQDTDVLKEISEGTGINFGQMLEGKTLYQGIIDETDYGAATFRKIIEML